MPGLSNYPPGVSGNEPQIIGGPDFYLKCVCGEVFEDINDAAVHISEPDVNHPDEFDTPFTIVPEGEAF